jgi:hypothetical protein
MLFKMGGLDCPDSRNCATAPDAVRGPAVSFAAARQSVELSNENNKPGNTKGVARDNHGNVFKVSVYN